MCLAGVCAETTPCGRVPSKDGRAIWMCALYSQSCQGVFRTGPGMFWLHATDSHGTTFSVSSFCSVFLIFACCLNFHTSSASLSICDFCILANNAWVSLMNETEINVLRAWCFRSIKCSSCWVKSYSRCQWCLCHSVVFPEASSGKQNCDGWPALLPFAVVM